MFSRSTSSTLPLRWSGREYFGKDTSRQFHQPLPLCHNPASSHFGSLKMAAHEAAFACPAAYSALLSAGCSCASNLKICTIHLHSWFKMKGWEHLQKIDIHLEKFCLQGKPLQSQCQAWAGGTQAIIPENPLPSTPGPFSESAAASTGSTYSPGSLLRF